MSWMSKTYESAVRLLARREHGAYELAQKLSQKGHPQGAIAEALLKCQDLGLQSDVRFVELVCQSRIRQGYGPIRIRQELQSKQIAGDLIEQGLEQQACWLRQAQDVYQKKYKACNDVSFQMIQKQKQFLLYRGFPMDIINQVFRDMN